MTRQKRKQKHNLFFAYLQNIYWMWATYLRRFCKKHKSESSIMILNATNIYRKYSSNELLRRLFLASLSSNNRIANNSGEVTFVLSTFTFFNKLTQNYHPRYFNDRYDFWDREFSQSFSNH